MSKQHYFSSPCGADKYIICTDPQLGFLKTCAANKVWNQAITNCVYKYIHNDVSGTDNAKVTNPCPGHPGAFFAHPINAHQYIHCNAYNEGYVQTCNNGEFWEPSQTTCVRHGIFAAILGK
jgi:hypothetical protein